MADPPPYPDSNLDTSDDTGVGSHHESTTGTPRWVKVFGIIGIALVLLVVIMLLTGGGPGGHGPGRHTRSDGAPAGQTRTTSVTEHGV